MLFANVDTIVHAGDIGSRDVLIALEALAPVQAVMGNTDVFGDLAQLPAKLQLNIEGKRILLMHRPPNLYGFSEDESLVEAFDTDIIVHGHTHLVRNERNRDILLLNPGSAGNARVTSNPSVAFLELKKEKRHRFKIVRLAALPL